jgi:hypothetical protein
VPDPVEELVESLLYEGYALYPYTPGATKNATPTPFGIVYPPTYAAECPGAFDHARLECWATAEVGASLTASLRYLVASGERHEATEQRVDLGPVDAGERSTAQLSWGRFTVRSEPADDGKLLVRACVHNTQEVPPGLGRAEALAYALLSTQIVVRISAGRFVSPLEDGAQSVNTFPVLASEADDVVLGTTIVLPDHPQIAPESRGALFDSTEIEEALLLHVHALSDGERAAIEEQDPAVREMISRAAAATPEEIMALHGRVTLRDPVTTEPPVEPADLPDPRRGESEAVVDGVRFCRGAHVIIRPGQDADVHARMLEGRTATIERIFTDYDGRTHLALTIDDDPGQELLRESGRFLFFFAHEVEVFDHER